MIVSSYRGGGATIRGRIGKKHRLLTELYPDHNEKTQKICFRSLATAMVGAALFE